MEADKNFVIGPAFPKKCGIATHVDQYIKKNSDCILISQPEYQGDIRINLFGLSGIWNWLVFIKPMKRKQLRVHFVQENFLYSGRSVLRMFNLFILVSIRFALNKNDVLVIHEMPWNRFLFQKLNMHLFRNVNYVFFSSFEQKNFESIFKFKCSNFLIERLELNYIKSFNPIGSQKNSRAKYNIGDAIILGHVGFIHENKGIDLVVETLATLRDVLVEKNIEYHIFGDIRDENDIQSKAYLENLIARSKSLKIPVLFHIYFYSDIDLDELFTFVDLLILPYKTNSNSGILARANLYHCPSIVSDIGSMHEYVNEKDRIFSLNRSDLRKKILKHARHRDR